MNQKQIEIFRLLCQTNSMSMTAQASSVSLDEVTLTTKMLEDELCTELFVKDQETFMLTDMGRHFLTFLDQDMPDWDGFFNTLSNGPTTKIIRLGLSLTHADPDFISKISNYQSGLFKTRIVFVNGDDDPQFIMQLRHDELDVALTRTVPEYSSLRHSKIGEHIPYVLLSKQNPLSAKRSIDFYLDLCGQNCLISSPDIAKDLQPNLEKIGAKWEYLAADKQAIQDAIANDRGFYPLPFSSVRIFENEHIVARALKRYPIRLEIMLVYQLNPSVEISGFIQFLERLTLENYLKNYGALLRVDAA